jgi:hypothetical protein
MEENNQKKFMVTEELFVRADKRFFNFAIDMIMLSILLFIGLVIFLSNTLDERKKQFYGSPNK